MALVKVDWKPNAKKLRGFGLVSLGFLVLIGVWIQLRHDVLFWDFTPDRAAGVARILWIVGAVCGLLAVAAPRALLPAYVLLTAVSLPIGWVVSHLVVGLLYYGVLTPVALVFRLIRRDVLDRHFDPGAESYWVPRERVKSRERYFRQY